MTQCWAPTVVRVSGDKSVRGQLSQSKEGDLVCDFPSRLILVANHQVCGVREPGKPELKLYRFTQTGCTCGGSDIPRACTAIYL